MTATGRTKVATFTAAPPPKSSYEGILFVKGMAINTMSFTGINGGEAIASHLIFPVANNLKMHRINASTYAAKVIALLFRGQRVIYKHFPHYAMRVLSFAAHLDAGIPVRVNAALPQPAGTAFVGNGGVNLDLLKQAGHAGQERVSLDKREFAGFTLATHNLAALFAVVSTAITLSSIGVEFGARFFNTAFTTSLEGVRIGIGHRCLQLGNVT